MTRLLGIVALVAVVAATVFALFVVPADANQGDAQRIMRTLLGSRWRWLLVPLLAVPLSWILFQGLGRDPRTIPSPLIGKPLPALAGPTLDGGTFDAASLAGRAAVVNVWASWCVECADEHPLLMVRKAV